MAYKLVSTQHSAKHPKGLEITDPNEIAKVLAGHTRKRFVKVAISDAEAEAYAAKAAAHEAK